MRKKTNIFRKVLIYMAIIAISIYALFPTYWMLISSFRTYQALYSSTSLIPGPFSMQSYKNLLGLTNFMVNLKNSLYVAFASTGITIVLSILMGYALTRYQLKGRKIILRTLLLTYLFPPLLLAVPLYYILVKIGLINTLWALIFSHITFTLPLGVWLALGFFKNLPFELEEAAMVDGATRLGAFFRVVLPQTRPGLLTIGIFSFLLSWTDYTFGLIMTSDDTMKTLPVGLATMVGAMDLNWGEAMAGSFLITLPLLLMFTLVGKYFVKGLAEGALKG